MTRSPTTERLKADAEGISRAAAILSEGGLVAFPTETVYGLGADARNDEAVAAIFEAKGRPSFNPLIVHVANTEAARRIGILPETAESLVAEGWPKALTLVVPVREGSDLSPRVTAGQKSVALRVPLSDVAQALLVAFDGPIAAPSANPSGRVSSTTAEHVLVGLGGRIDAVIDGGPTEAGLESTIVSFLEPEPVLLREGTASVEIEELKRFTTPTATDRPISPGQLASHYAPRATIRLNATEAREGETLIGFGPISGDLTLSASGDLNEAARKLFALLHEADRAGVTKLAVAPIPEEGIGRAINDRLRRAAAPRDA